MFLHADSEDSDQTGWILSCHGFVGFVMSRLNYCYNPKIDQWFYHSTVMHPKDANEPCHDKNCLMHSPRSLISIFVVCCFDSATSVLAISKVSRL